MNIEDLIQKEVDAIKNIPITSKELDKVAWEIIHCTGHSPHGRIVTSGVGKAGMIARLLSSTLCSIGIPALFLDPLNAQHGDLGIIREADCLFVISNSGQTREIIELISLVFSLNRNENKVIALVGNKDTSIDRLSNLCLYTGLTEEICPLGLTPTTSTTVMKVICDLLVVKIMEITNYKKEEYHARHHGGYLGQKSK